MTQEQAQNRNWQKRRLMGIRLDTSNLTEDEKALVSVIITTRNKMLKNWDKNSYILSDKPMPPHKCVVCGKRSNVKYEYDEGYILCRKHYKEWTNKDTL